MSFRTAMISAVTANGDKTNATTNSPLLDFFSGINRKSENLEKTLLALLPKCWDENPLALVKLIFYKRDIRGGAGERKVFEIAFRWLLENHTNEAIYNIIHIPFYGSYKDLTKLMDHPKAVDEVTNIFATTLVADLKKVEQNQPITLAAKWAPSLKSHMARKCGADHKIAEFMGMTTERRGWEKKYRGMLRTLRDRLMIVEHLMSTGDWEHINYSIVPSLAMQRYRKAFERHSPTEWKAYRAALVKGDAKINSTVLMPYQIIERGNLTDTVVEAQWRTMVEDVRKKGGLENTIAMCDVSGSMMGMPMNISISLGILISEIASKDSNFANLLISFTEKPRFFDLTGKSLANKVEAIRREVGYNTDLAYAFQIILQRAVASRVPATDMPRKIILISDMQFDQADRRYNSGSFDVIQRLYTAAGYTMPEVVFWNVSSATNTFPVTNNDIGVCMVSGFSQNILNSVLRGVIQDPIQVMMETLNSERYDRITIT